MSFYENASGYIITDRCLEVREQWLRSNISPKELATHSPTDCTLFTFSRKEPANRWTTRIGGVPAWPLDTPWPECKGCDESLAFVAQFDFRDTCLATFVPGDVLIFHYCFACSPWESESAAKLTWRNDTSEELVDEALVPDDIEDDEPGPCYGTPHKVTDYTRLEPHGDYGYYTLMGTKIGGYPPEIQPIDPPLDSEGHKMRFLASLGSLRASDVPKIPSTPAVGDLIWFDMGCVYFWGAATSKRFETAWSLTCY